MVDAPITGQFQAIDGGRRRMKLRLAQRQRQGLGIGGNPESRERVIELVEQLQFAGAVGLEHEPRLDADAG